MFMTEKSFDHLLEKTVDEKKIFDGKILRLYHDTVELPDGCRAMREYCRHNGGVCVLPVTDDGKIFLVRQYRYPHGKLTLEIPAGKLEDKDADIYASAVRELREETGATSDNVTYLGKILPSPAILSEVIHLFLATDLSFGEKSPDDDEFLECEAVPFDDALGMVLSGEIAYDVECNPLHGPRVQAIIEKLEAGNATPKLTYVEESAFDAAAITPEMLDSRGY